MRAGTQANYGIYDSTFENNYAKKGGAIYIEGPITSLSLAYTNFSQNVASSQGGAIYFANNSKRFENSVNKFPLFQRH